MKLVVLSSYPPTTLPLNLLQAFSSPLSLSHHTLPLHTTPLYLFLFLFCFVFLFFFGLVRFVLKLWLWNLWSPPLTILPFNLLQHNTPSSSPTLSPTPSSPPVSLSPHSCHHSQQPYTSVIYCFLCTRLFRTYVAAHLSSLFAFLVVTVCESVYWQSAFTVTLFSWRYWLWRQYWFYSCSVVCDIEAVTW